MSTGDRAREGSIDGSADMLCAYFVESRIRLDMKMGLFWICGEECLILEVGAETGDVC